VHAGRACTADTVAAILGNQVAKHLEMIGRAVNELGGSSVTNIQNNVVPSPAFWQVRFQAPK
jgi:hypothetical protein